MSKIGAKVLVIFQCHGINPTPSQGDTLMLGYSPSFDPTMYKLNFTWVEMYMLKTWTLPRTGVGWGRSNRYYHPTIYHDPAIDCSILCDGEPVREYECMYKMVYFCQFVLKILSGNEILV